MVLVSPGRVESVGERLILVHHPGVDRRHVAAAMSANGDRVSFAVHVGPRHVGSRFYRNALRIVRVIHDRDLLWGARAGRLRSRRERANRKDGHCRDGDRRASDQGPKQDERPVRSRINHLDHRFRGFPFREPAQKRWLRGSAAVPGVRRPNCYQRLIRGAGARNLAMKETAGAVQNNDAAARQAGMRRGASKGATRRKNQGKWLQAYAARRRRNMIVGALAVAAVAAMVAAALVFVPLGNPGEGNLNTQLHQHMALEIFINGERAVVPANIGIDPSLSNDPSLSEFGGMGNMAPIHTHDTLGKLHVEMRKWHPMTLGDVFKIWGEPFERNRVLDYQGPIRLEVNAQPNDEFRDLVLQDGQLIRVIAG